MKRTIFIILPIVALLLSGCSIDIKSNKELQQERTKKQEINNTISGLNQQISGLEQTLIGLNQEIDLLQPKDNSGNEQMSSGLDLSGLDLADSTGIIKAINALDKQPITGSQLNWLEKFFNRFKELFNGGNKQAIGPQLSGLASTGLESEGTGINTGGDVKTEESYLPKVEVKKKTYIPTETPTEKCQRIYGMGVYYNSKSINTNQCDCIPGYKRTNNYSSCIKIVSNGICEKEFGEGAIQGYYGTQASDGTTCLCKEGYTRGNKTLCVKK